MKKEELLHDLRGPLAKIKTAVNLMNDATLAEIQEDYLPILEAATHELEREFERLAKIL